jgi:hypothetical protein
MGNEIDVSALRASNVKFSNGALKGMSKDTSVQWDGNAVGSRKPVYLANLEDNKDGYSACELLLWEKQPNGSKVNKVNDYEFDFTKLSNANIHINNDSKVNNIYLFGCAGTRVEARNNKLDRINIFNTKDSKSSYVEVHMNKGDELNDYTRNVEIEAKGNTGYLQIGDKGYSITTDVGVAERTKRETHNDNGKVTTSYYAKDGKELNERYALSKVRKTSDGYSIRTYQDGTKSIVDKNGKALPAGTKVRILKTKDGKETVQIVKK